MLGHSGFSAGFNLNRFEHGLIGGRDRLIDPCWLFDQMLFLDRLINRRMGNDLNPCRLIHNAVGDPFDLFVAIDLHKAAAGVGIGRQVAQVLRGAHERAHRKCKQAEKHRFHDA